MAAVDAVAERLPANSRPGDLTGALGDSITVFPVVVALAALTPLALGPVLALFGVFQVAWGLRYRLPMSVEPMKALAGLAIAGSLTAGEFAAAGLLAGAVLVVLGTAGLLDDLAAWVGEPVVRGVQLAVALELGLAGVDLAAGNPGLAAGAAVVVVVATAAGRPGASALLLAGVGVAVAAVTAGVPAPSLPAFGPPPLSASVAVLDAAAGQLAMTVGNAAIATSLLCADLFDAEVRPDDLATSMGTMTLAAVPLGGVPMCHGSGGLAGKHAFGARTALANLVVGGLYVVAAVFAGGGLLAAFPMALLGVLLLVVAGSLGRTALGPERRWLAAAVGGASLVVGLGPAFVGAVLVDRLLSRRGSRGSPSP